VLIGTSSSFSTSTNQLILIIGSWCNCCDTLCTCCCQSSQMQSQRSHPSVSARVKDNWVHLIQAPLTWLQSYHNHRTFISAWPHHISVSSKHSLFIFGHTRSPIHIIFSTNNRSFLPACFPSSLESTPGFPPSTTHKSLQLCLTQFFEWHFLHQFHRLTTLIIHHPFTLSLQAKKLSFSANPSHHSRPFLPQDWLHGFSRLWAYPFFMLTFFVYHF